MKRKISVFYAKEDRSDLRPTLSLLRKEGCIITLTNEKEFVADLLNSEYFIGFVSQHSLKTLCSMIDMINQVESLQNAIHRVFLVVVDDSKNELPKEIANTVPVILLFDLVTEKGSLINKILATRIIPIPKTDMVKGDTKSILKYEKPKVPVIVPELKETRKLEPFPIMEEKKDDTAETESSLQASTEVETPEQEEEPPEVRKLQCHTHEKGRRRRHSLNFIRPNLDYEIAVCIGLPKKEFRGGDSSFPVKTLEEKYPKEELPTGEKGWTLDVVFYLPDAKSEPQNGKIFLPSNEDSSLTLFFFKSPGSTGLFMAKIVVLYKNRILQTARYEIPVCKNIKEFINQNYRNTLVIEALFEPNLNELGKKKGFDAALLFNQGDDANIVVMKGQKAKKVPFKEIEGQVEIIKNEISELTTKKTTPNLNEAAAKNLLYTLAHQGQLMVKTIKRSTGELDISGANRLQLTEAHGGAITPIEFCYGRIAPEEDAILCENSVASLENGICPDCPYENTREERTRICPLGFWGLNRVLERHHIIPKDVSHLGYIYIEDEKKGDREKINPFISALFGASAKADQDNPDVTKNLFEKIKEVTINKDKVFKAETWKEWESIIDGENPTLLVLLVHTVDSDPKSKTPAIEIGYEQLLRSSEIQGYHIRSDTQKENKPVVLLIGCSTAVSSIVHHSFIPNIQDNGASIVLATITDALGQHAGPLLEDFLATLKQESQKTPVSFGEVLLHVRQKLLAQSKLLSLSLVSFGDADYMIS